MVVSIVMEAVMDTSEFPNDETGVGPWVVELKVAGCTIRRRAERRRHLLDPRRELQPCSPA